MSNIPYEQEAPIAIGAIGGSGTRVVARIIEAAGVFMGNNLNHAHDNLEFTARFKKPDILNATDAEFDKHLKSFTELMHRDMVSSETSHWGWKEPNTHIVVDRLLRRFPKMRYVHLLRNGLDMAFSENKNQVRLWGPILLKRNMNEPPSPAETLEYFCEVHRRLTALAASPEAQGRIIFIHFEELCRHPRREVLRLLNFLQLLPSVGQRLDNLTEIISPPLSMGRWMKHGQHMFRPEDLDYIRANFPKSVND